VRWSKLTGALVRSEMLIRDFQIGTDARNVDSFALVAFVEFFRKSKKGNSWEMATLTFHEKTNVFSINLEKEKAVWLLETIDEISIHADKNLTFNQLKAKYELDFDDFELFWYSKPIQILKENGVILTL
jgi:hypothetical protein